MEIAHILVTCEDKREDELIEDMRSIEEIREIKKTFGAYNAIIRIEAESVQNIKRIMAEKIRNRSGILSTLTLVSV